MAVTNLFRDMIFVCQCFGIKCNRRKDYEPKDIFNPKFTLRKRAAQKSLCTVATIFKVGVRRKLEHL